ncbi:MAG: hypothetical protein ABH811_01160 [archaeon]
MKTQMKPIKKDKPKTIKEEQDEIFADAKKDIQEHIEKLDEIIED